jgi:hypothetical protein
MKAFIAACIILLFSPGMLMAGGDRFVAEIVSLDPLPPKPDEFRLVLRQFTEPYSGQKYAPPRLLTIRLRHNAESFGWLPRARTYYPREEYLECITVLKQQLARGKRIKFGVINNGYEPIKGSENEWQSNTLTKYLISDDEWCVTSIAQPGYSVRAEKIMFVAVAVFSIFLGWCLVLIFRSLRAPTRANRSVVG